MKKILLLCLTISLIVSANCQFPLKGNFKRLSFDVYGGIPIFHGDTKNKFGDLTYTFTGRLNYNLTSAFTIGAEFSYGSMKGKDTDGSLAYFHNRYMKTVLGMDVHLFNVLHFDQISHFFQPFVGLGFGAVKSDMEGSGYNGIDDVFQYNDWAYGYQLNFGTKFKLSKTFDLNIRYSAFFASVDLIDNSDFAVPSNKNNDVFSELNIGFTMHFGKKENQAVIWKNSESFNTNNVESALLKNDSISDLLTKQDSTINSLNNNQLKLEQKINSFEDKLKILSESSQKEVEISPVSNVVSNDTKSKNLDTKEYQLANGDYMYIGELQGAISAEYYVVIGSFRLKSNAIKDQTRWKEKGFDTYLMIEIKSGLYRIVVDYADDHTEALKILEEYKQKLNSETWMIKTAK